LRARAPGNWGALLYLARIETDQGEDGAERHYRQTLAGLARAKAPAGEARARLGLALFLGRRGRFAEADAEVEAAEVAAHASGERGLELADAYDEARAFAVWAFAYHRFAGELLAASRRSAAEFALAFEITERMRARLLLDELDAVRASAAFTPRDDLALRRGALLDEVARAERILQAPDLTAGARAAGAARLAALRADEARLREALFAAHPEYRDLRAPRLATLAGVRRDLAPDQLLIAFQVASRFNVDNRTTEHGSWIWSVSRDRVAVAPVPDQAELTTAVDLFQGLIARRDDAEREAASALYHQLFGDLLARATEARLKGADLAPFGVLHFAAHARIDDRRPELSAIVLARGAKGARTVVAAPARALWPALLAALALAAGYYVSRRRGKGSRRRPDALS